MKIQFTLNGKMVRATVEADTVLLDTLRAKGCYSVKRGCETSNCGLCTVWLNKKPILSCATLSVRADGCEVTTLEGIQEDALRFGEFLSGEGAEQCGFCNPGLIMNVIAMERELDQPSEDEIKEYLAGNLCRCSGYVGQLRAIRKYLNQRREA